MNSITNKQFFAIKSKSSDFTVELKVDQLVNFKYVVITAASIPKSYYALPQDATITVTTNVGTYTVTIDKANYNPLSLAIIMTNKFASVGLIVSISYPNPMTEPDTNKFTWVFPIGTTSVEISASTNYMAHMIGLNAAGESSVQLGTQWISPFPLDYQSHNKIVIKSNMVDNSGENLQEIVSNGNPYNSAISYVCPSLAAHFRNIKTLNSNVYRFYIVDEEEQLINFNNQEINFTLCIFKSTEVDRLLMEDIRLRASVMHDTLQSQ